MRFVSFGTQYKFPELRAPLVRDEIYTGDPTGGWKLAFIVETAHIGAQAGRTPGYHVDGQGRAVVVVPEEALDGVIVRRACHQWMEHNGLPDEPVWFMALPPGKEAADFFTWWAHDQ